MATNSEVYRPVVHADCELVMAIDRNVDGGLDYLQHKFHAFVLDPLRFPFIAEYNGEVVGYQCGHVIDDGLSIVLEAARVRADLQGKGFANKLLGAVVKAARVKFPNLQRAMWSTINMELTQKYKRIIKVVAQRPALCFNSNYLDLHALCCGAAFQHLFTHFGADNIDAIPRRLAINLLKDGINFAAAVPEEMLLVTFQPWGLYQSNYVELLKVVTLHVMEDNEHQGVGHEKNIESAIPSVSNKTGTGSISCFSFHSEIESISGGMQCRVDFYCPTGERATAKAAAHLLYHMREFTSCHQNADMSFSFLIPQHIDKPTLKRILTDELGLHCIITNESDRIVCTRILWRPQAKF